MNIERITQLREFIATLSEDQCDMDLWLKRPAAFNYTEDPAARHTCGTVGCLGGWCTTLIPNESEFPYEDRLVKFGDHQNNQLAPRYWLELDKHEAELLFYSYPEHSPLIGWQKWMLRRLDLIIDSGVIVPFREM